MFGELLAALGLFMLTVATPGPDLLVVTRTAVASGCRAGIATALGIGCGLVFHNAYALFGVALLISKSPAIFAALKLAGALYLGYLACRMLFSKGFVEAAEHSAVPSRRGAFFTGLAINIFNAKAMLWILFFYTSVLPGEMSFAYRSVFAAAGIAGATGFFALLAFFASRERVIAVLRKAGVWFDRTAGILLLYFALRILLEFL